MSSYVTFTDMPDLILIYPGTALTDKPLNYLFASPLPYPHINTNHPILFNSDKTLLNIDSVRSHDDLPLSPCCHFMVDRKGKQGI